MSFIDILFPRACPFCEKRLETEVCPCEGALPYSDDAYAPLYYVGAAAEAIKRFKFSRKFSYAGIFARLMCEGIIRDEFDLVLAVPSYKDKTEHAAVLGGVVAKELRLPPKSGVLLKIKATEKQHNLDAKARETNLKAAFEVRKREAVTGKRVLLVDDVTTTGSTFAECRSVLLAAGAASVKLLTIAKTEKFV